MWALTIWALAASAAVVWLAFALSMRVELLAELSAGRNDLWIESASPAGGSDWAETSPLDLDSITSRRLLAPG